MLGQVSSRSTISRCSGQGWAHRAEAQAGSAESMQVFHSSMSVECLLCVCGCNAVSLLPQPSASLAGPQAVCAFCFAIRLPRDLHCRYDAGDTTRFTFPAAYTIATLALGYLAFPEGYQRSGQDVALKQNLRCGTKQAAQLMQCRVGPGQQPGHARGMV